MANKRKLEIELGLTKQDCGRDVQPAYEGCAPTCVNDTHAADCRFAAPVAVSAIAPVPTWTEVAA